MSRYKYIHFELKTIPGEFCIQYNPDQYVHIGYVYAETRKVMYGLEQLGRITQYQLFDFLEPFDS